VVEREQAGLDELREAAERLQVDVTDRFNALREVAGNEFTRIMRELSARFDANKAGAGASGEELLDRVYAELRAECAELSERLDAEVGQIAADIAAVVGDLDVELASLELGADIFAPAGGSDAVDTADPMMRLRIASAVASGGTGFTMFARYIGTDLLLASMLGAGALLAVTVAAINVKMSRRQRDEAGIRKQVQAALEGARTEVSPVLRQQILSVQRELERAMKASIRQQSKGYQARIAEATQLARSDAATRQAAKADAERRMTELAPFRQRIDALVTELDRILGAP
jgi:DNA anti-recombination protein RmuC